MRQPWGRRLRLPLLILGGLTAVAALRAHAATRIVDQTGGTPYSTIQSAIDAAVPGQDEVFVRCGRYPENVVMEDGVSSRGAGAHCTTIDGQRLGSVVRMPVIEQPTELSGFTLRGGSLVGRSLGLRRAERGHVPPDRAERDPEQ